MQKGLRVIVPAFSLLLLLGAGCTKTLNSEEVVNSETDLNSATSICVRPDADVTGIVELYAANATPQKENFTVWFTDAALAKGDAREEICGNAPFSVAIGDTVYINGSWSDANGERWLVENKTADASGSDVMRDIWINDEYYAVGQECAYRSNGMKGFDVVCTVR